MTGLVIGIDVGGTFTDIVAAGEGRVWRAKVPTVPADFAAGVIAACEAIAARLGIGLDELMARTARFGLGTTAVTNVIVSREGTRAGLLTTAGFEDVLPTARGRRVNVDGWLQAPWSPIPDALIAGIPERIVHDGSIVRPLDEDAVRAAAHRLIVEEQVAALAVSYLWSFVNDAHERRTAGILRSEHPGVPVFVGSELHPVLREYDRTTVACLNAICAGSVEGVATLERTLRARGLRAPFLVLRANGGSMTVERARLEPLSMVDSGPAAGAVAAADLVVASGLGDALCADMGGTSYDVAIVAGGQPLRRQRGQVAGVMTAQSSVDVESVGSGGGSIAWIDKRGVLRVGPRSARALPGPACYGRGGIEATVTDAMLVLGYLDPDNFLGGSMSLDPGAARTACARLGDRLGLGVEETAWGIREIALADMIRATRTRMATAGCEPGSLALVTYGGSGSLFTPDIAAQLAIPKVLSPALASVLSAFGAATAPVRSERTRNVKRMLDAIDPARLADDLRALSERALADVADSGAALDARSVEYEVDLRFVQQVSELTLAIDPALGDPGSLAGAFKQAYEARYGVGAIILGIPIEVVSVRAIATAQVPRAVLPAQGRASTTPLAARSQRPIWIDRDRPTTVTVHARDALVTGDVIEGPALVEDLDTTLWVPRGARASLDALGTLNVALAT